MSSLDPSTSPARIVAVVATAALVALAVVVRYGFDSGRTDGALGTPAQSASGAQRGSAEASSAALADLARNPAVAALVRDPGFPAAARVMRLSPGLARLLAAGDVTALAVAGQGTAQAMERNAEGMQAAQRAADSARAAMDTIEAQKVLSGHPDLNRYANWLVEMSKVAPWRTDPESQLGQLPALNAAFAHRLAARSAAAGEAMATTGRGVEAAAGTIPELRKFLQASADAIRLAPSYAEAADRLAGSREVVELAARDAAAVRPPMVNAEAARALQDAAALKVLRAHREGVEALLAAPGAARLLRDPEAAREALVGAAEGAGK